jgi:uracil-DNA glycosylase
MSGLSALIDDIGQCRICRDRPRGKPLAHAPRPILQVSSRARLLIAGQAPGTKAHASGRPFADASGDRLRRWLGIGPEIFYDPERVAIVPMGFCFPGQDARGADLPPRSECAARWRTPLMAALPSLKLILAVGLHAQAWHLGGRRKGSLSETVRAWREPFDGLKPAVIPLPHPSWRNSGWLKNNPWFEAELLPALRMEVGRLLGGGTGSAPRQPSELRDGAEQ